MGEQNVIATARVRLVVDVECGSWGNDCTLQQVEEQAGREARTRLANQLGKGQSKPIGVIIGEPEVFAVMTRRP